MTKADRPAFATRITAVAEVFGATLSKAAIELYFRALEDLSLEAVSLGLSQCVRRNAFMARPAEIRTAAIGRVEDRARRVYRALQEAAGRYGSTSDLYIEDPVAAVALARVYGGFSQFASASDDAYARQARRREFCEAYKSVAASGEATVGTFVYGRYANRHDPEALVGWLRSDLRLVACSVSELPVEALEAGAPVRQLPPAAP